MTDAEILDALEAVMADEFKLELHRTWFSKQHWQVGFSSQFTQIDGQLRCSGGGMSLREAIQNALKNDEGRRIKQVTDTLLK